MRGKLMTRSSMPDRISLTIAEQEELRKQRIEEIKEMCEFVKKLLKSVTGNGQNGKEPEATKQPKN